jgi:hypothetical protein
VEGLFGRASPRLSELLQEANVGGESGHLCFDQHHRQQRQQVIGSDCNGFDFACLQGFNRIHGGTGKKVDIEEAWY